MKVGSTRRARLTDDRGSITPLILGFFLIALYVVAGAVAASDAFTRQRDLQSICDGTAIAAANSADAAALHGVGTTGKTLPLADVNTAIVKYLSNDTSRSKVQARGSVSQDGGTVQVRCVQHTHIAFGAMFLLGNGLDQSAIASARSVIAG
jgi:acyl-coenzyme A thioesterase PaaI-like protein